MKSGRLLDIASAAIGRTRELAGGSNRSSSRQQRTCAACWCMRHSSLMKFQRIFTCKIWRPYSRERALARLIQDCKISRLQDKKDCKIASFKQKIELQMPFCKISAKFRSFSAVSAPIFASKYGFFSILRNLPDCLAEFFEIWQYFANFATSANFLLYFHKNC